MYILFQKHSDNVICHLYDNFIIFVYREKPTQLFFKLTCKLLSHLDNEEQFVAFENNKYKIYRKFQMDKVGNNQLN